MSDFQFVVVVGLLAANIFASLLTQRMLENHHEQATRDGDDEGESGVDGG